LRLVALNKSRDLGIDFSNNNSPVVDDSSFRIILLLIGDLRLKPWSIDVETAFLYGYLDKEICMKIPDGFEMNSGPMGEATGVLRLEKSLYGLVQAPRQWNRNFEEEIFNTGFKKNHVDPCGFLREEEKDSVCSTLMLLMQSWQVRKG
jgi:Reverse transcriptase (RNA-dependent DNA polymerase)